jgi:hypothetical protein
MPQHKATLIQDIREFLDGIGSLVRYFMTEYHFQCGITEEDAIRWIIAEELELVYGLFAKGHIHNRIPHADIHAQVNNHLSMPLSRYVTAHIRASSI